MVSEIWARIVEFIENWGTNETVAALVAVLLTTVLSKIWKLLVRLAGWVWAQIQGRGADRAFEREYLNWLIGQHCYLGLLPAQVVARRWGERRQFVELENVYVRLSVSARGGDEHWAVTYGEGESSWRKRPWFGERLIRHAVQYLMPPELREMFPNLMPLRLLDRFPILNEEEYRPGDPYLTIDRHRRLVIRGEPGSGKTTLLRYLAVTCARALRNNKENGDSSRLVKRRLFWDKRPFPIFVTLSRHIGLIGSDKNCDLIETFLMEMPPQLRRKCPKNFFERRLCDGDCLILLDGFDELGSLQARRAMARCIAGFPDVYSRSNARIVVTTRIVGYEDQLDRYGFEVRTIQDMNAGEIRTLVKQRYKAIILSETAGLQTQEAQAIKQRLMRRSEVLITKIEETPRLRQLASNPMLLSLIVLVHSLKVRLPEERVLLYRDCVGILTERWQRMKQEEVDIPNERDQELTLNQKIALLSAIAFGMQQLRQEETSQTLVPKDHMQEIVADKLPDLIGMRLSTSERAQREACLRKAEEWINSIQVESGILVERGLDRAGEPLIGFSHLTFQEYLAAVAADEVEAYRPFLWRNLLNPAWREVVLLYTVMTSSNSQFGMNIAQLLD